MSSLLVVVSQKSLKGISGWEGSVSLCGLTKAKLTSKTGKTLFATRGALNAVARNFGKSYGLEVAYQEPQAAKKSPTKAPQAKKSTAKRATKAKTATPAQKAPTAQRIVAATGTATRTNTARAKSSTSAS